MGARMAAAMYRRSPISFPELAEYAIFPFPARLSAGRLSVWHKGSDSLL
jgi:hypothetical protein